MLGRGLIALAVAGASAFLLLEDAGTPAPPLAVAEAKPPILTLDRPVGGTLYFSAAVPSAASDPRPVKVLPGDARTWHVSAWGEHVVVNTESVGSGAARAFDLRAGRTIATDAHLERDRSRIAALSPAGDLEIVGRHDPACAIFNLEWELG